MKVDIVWKRVPVSIFFAVLVIIIFLLYITSLVKTLPCGDTILSQFYANFIHTDPYHIFSNLLAIYALSRVEQKIGVKKFMCLIVFLLLVNTLLEMLAKKLKPSLPCSIGFSGILFGIATWEMVAQKDVDLYILGAIAVMVISPSLTNRKASLLSHGIGAFTGIVGGLLYRLVMRKDTTSKKSGKKNKKLINSRSSVKSV